MTRADFQAPRPRGDTCEEGTADVPSGASRGGPVGRGVPRKAEVATGG